MIEIFEFRSVFSQKANTCHDPKTGRFCKISNAKSVTGKSPEGATLGKKLAREYGLPNPENGYYWKGYKSGNIVYKNLPGHKVPPRFFDPKTKQFRNKSSVPSGERGILGEDKADSYMAQQGFKKVGGPHNISGNGLDGVYAKEKPPPPKYVVGEAKFGMAKIKKQQMV